MFRVLLLVHRYVGIAIGLLVLLWCLSAFVMMYVQFPQLSEREQLAALPVLDTEHCCKFDVAALSSSPEIMGFVIDSLASQPVLRVRIRDGYSRSFDLVTGTEILAIDEETARRQAISYFTQAGISNSARLLSIVDRDQWTVAGNYDPLRSFYLFAANDAQASRIYISEINGIPVQDTTRYERGWNWVGSVIHWIYPTILRKHVGTWAQVVIWTTLISLFLVVVGIYLGIRQFRVQRDGGFSPYKGMALWHHYTSLIFGVLTLTWLLSGLFSMTPWGLFASEGASAERQAIQGMTISASDLSFMLESLPVVTLPKNTVRIRSAPYDGDFAVLALGTDNAVSRLHGHSLDADPLDDEDWSRLPALLAPESDVIEAGWITKDDEFYFSHHEKVELPVYRIIVDDAEHTRYYHHRKSAELIRKVDAGARGFRWWFHALHRGDFATLSQKRPLWDFIMLPLLIGVTIGAITGVYLGFRRLISWNS